MSRPEAAAEDTALRPFLKWAGGKYALLPQILQRFPRSFGRYYEPFLGGGATFLSTRYEGAILADQNQWLIDTYRAVRWSAGRVICELEQLPNTRESYLAIRARDPKSLALAARAAQFIYLNKTGFRGLFRVNQKGGFNVPYGDYARRTHDPAHLRSVGRALRSVELRCGDFESGLQGIRKNDFAYLDPPYVKLGGHSDFNRYTETRFTMDDHGRLADHCRHLTRRGVRWLLSQSDTEVVRELFDGFEIERVEARREINLDSKKRDVGEVLVRG